MTYALSVDPKIAQKRAWKYGHYWGHSPDVTLYDAISLDINHPLAQQAWESWRAADANYLGLLNAEHQRFDAIDATFGPATENLVRMKRCPLPDMAPPDGVEFAGLDDWEVYLLENYREWARREEATGSGSWPFPGCALGSEDVHSIRVNLQRRDASQSWKDDLPFVTEAVTKAYAEMGLRLLWVYDSADPDKESEINVSFASIPGGVIGWNEFPSRGTCKQTIRGKRDNDYRASAHMKAMLEGHELGHGVGLQHISGRTSWMNPTILNLDLSWRGDPHESTLTRYFGGQAIPVAPGPIDPPPPPPVPTDMPELDVTVRVGGRTYEFIGAPKPGV